MHLLPYLLTFAAALFFSFIQLDGAELTAKHRQNIAVARRYVEKLNNKKGLKWKAKVHSHIAKLDLAEKKRMLGLQLEEKRRPPVKPSRSTGAEIDDKNDDSNDIGVQSPLEVTVATSTTVSGSSRRRRRDNANSNNNSNNNGSGETGNNGTSTASTSKLEEKSSEDPLPQLLLLPNSFDSRQHWPACATIINHVRDQSGCGSCWAVSTSSSFTDRLCIAKTRAGQKVNASDPINYKSAEDILSCVYEKGRDGCEGGDPVKAMAYLYNVGTVSGHDYGTKGSCLPYPFPPADADTGSSDDYNSSSSSPHYDFRSPPCPQRCDKSFDRPFAKDKDFVSSYRTLKGDGNERQIMQELFQNGPLSAAFDVYDDFMYYASGIYSHVSGDYIGGHAVRVIGCGRTAAAGE